MKRIFKLLTIALVLVLLLSACADDNAPVNTGGGVVADSPPVSPSVVPSAPIVADGVVIPSPNMKLDGFDIGEKYERFYPDTTLGVIPREDYGELLPFIGGKNEFMWFPSPTYGFCTTDGKIVCDPTYANVEQLAFEGETVYILMRATGEAWDSEIGQSRMYLMAADGSFVSEYEEIHDGFEGTITVKKAGRWGSVDYFGKEVIPFMYEHPIFFGESVAAVTEDFSEGYKYIDKSNETVLGNLPAIPSRRVDQRSVWGYEEAYAELFRDIAFSRGRALYYEGDSYGYIDKTGKIIAMYRDDEGWFRGERFIAEYTVVLNGSQYAVIDTDANVIIPFSDTHIRIIKSGEETVFAPESTETRFYDAAGNELPWELDKSAYYYNDPSGLIFVQRKNGKFDALLKDGKEIPVPECSYFCVVSNDRIILSGPEGLNYDLLIDGNGTIIADSRADGENCRFRDYYPPDQDYVIYTRDYRLNGIMSFDGELITKPIFEVIEKFGEYYAVQGDRVGGLLDKDGKWVVKTALLSSND